MVEGGPIDVLTGDYLAELTMLILWKARQKDPSAGYARTFLSQLEQVLGTCLDRGIKIVNNAGGLNPAGLAAELGRPWPDGSACTRRSPTSTGDDLLARLGDLRGRRAAAGPPGHRPAAGRGGRASRSPPTPTWAAGASPRRWPPGPTSSSARGSPTPRWSSARPPGGTAGRATTSTPLAGAVVAGHVIECGPQATGGNYSFLDEITRPPLPRLPDRRGGRATAAA